MGLRESIYSETPRERQELEWQVNEDCPLCR
jgi:hypothetical protein